MPPIPLVLYIFLACLNFFTTMHSHAQVYSRLWGKNGELWDTTKIPDFTKAGYREGSKLPIFTSILDVKNFGAVGDGKTDNTSAFRKAIIACKKDQVIFFPEGTFLLSDSIVIGKSNIAIRGSGQGKTKLFFSKGLEQLYPDYNLHNKNQTGWSWSGGMILFQGNISDCGIEDLAISFPDSAWAGHNFHERCYNGIGFTDNAHNGWIKNVTITGADLGIWIGRSSHHITVENWVLDFGPVRGATKLNGHHGVNIYGGYNLLQSFELKGKFHHDLSVESKFSVYNVFRNGKGTDLCIDHHNHAQSYNLFTNLNMGTGSRPYLSGGNDTPRGISFHETYWNLRAAKPMLYCNQYDTDKHSEKNVCVGITTDQPSLFNDPYGNWFETIDPVQLYPQDLYEAQMRLKGK